MQQDIDSLKIQVATLTAIVDSLRNSSSIPFDIGAAFGDRLGTSVTFGSPGSTTYLKTVNESGVATYSVANAMDGRIPLVINGTTFNIPFYL